MAGEVTLLSLLPAGIALVGTGVAWGLLKGRQDAAEKRIEKLEECSESMTQMERVAADVERHELAIQVQARHLGETRQEVAVLRERTTAGTRRDPT